MHVISSKILRTPESYADALYVLAEAGILDSSEAEEFADMAKFRNILAHTYARVNLEMALESSAEACRYRENDKIRRMKSIGLPLVLSFKGLE